VPPPVFRPGAAVAVVMASGGYPESASKGDVITGIDAAEQLEGVHVDHAGTAESGGELVTAGGRVLAVVGTGADVAAARAAAYAGVDRISFDGAQYRTDIAAGIG
jgi:phosphoribosylamine--glycine ligase